MVSADLRAHARARVVVVVNERDWSASRNERKREKNRRARGGLCSKKKEAATNKHSRLVRRKSFSFLRERRR